MVFTGLATLLVACDREQRRFREFPAAHATIDSIPASEIAPARQKAMLREYIENAYAAAQGKKYFMWFNCVGCHSNGGGGMGPALMDEKWIYGGEPDDIYTTIAHGRPNGMPAFGGKVPRQQIWQLTAYVRSLAGLVRKDVAPGRSDQLSAKPPEMMHPRITVAPQ